MIEPAWYDDEQDPELSRWHDGETWTRHTVRKADWAEEPPPPSKDDAPEAPASVGQEVPPQTADPLVPSPERGPVPSLVVDELAAVKPPPLDEPLQAARADEPPKLKQPGRFLLPVVGVLLVVAVVLRLFVVDGGDDGDGAQTVARLREYSVEWETVDGSSYRLTVVPSSEPLTEASPGGCMEAPAAGRANLGATIRIENLSADTAPLPDVLFAVNATDDGSLDTSPESLAGANHGVEVTPTVDGVPCEEAYRIRSDGREPLASGATAAFDATVRGIVTPVPSGLALIVRYVQADPSDPEAPTTADFLAPFPPPPRVDG